MHPIARSVPILILLLCFANHVSAQEPAADPLGETTQTPAEETASTAETSSTAETALAPAETVTEIWRIGVSVQSGTAQCRNVFATFPVPGEWPEQSVRLVDRVVSQHVSAYQLNQLGEGLQRVELQMRYVPSGADATVTFDFEITKSRIAAPEDTSQYRAPERLDSELRKYLTSSPYIDPRHPKIRAAVAEAKLDENASAWQQVEAMYDWVREKVEYREGDIKQATEALEDGYGDCEELTSLFVAMCRAQRIPARMVWVPGHCYPEFYLENAGGEGRWFPCQAAGTRQFGSMDEFRPILQKGDRFKVPEKRSVQRYVSEFCKIDAVVGTGKPSVEFIRRRLDD